MTLRKSMIEIIIENDFIFIPFNTGLLGDITKKYFKIIDKKINFDE